jgi:hypothetical protein
MSRRKNKKLVKMHLTEQEPCDIVEIISRFLCTGERRGYNGGAYRPV